MTKYYYKTHNKLKEYLQCFINAYNFSKRLKVLQGLAVFDYINICWQNEPERFISDPRHMIPVTYRFSNPKSYAKAKLVLPMESLHLGHA